MTTRVQLLILLLLPALAVPRGTRLDWCLCSALSEASCCTDCCGKGEGPSEDPALEDPVSMGCCLQLQVEDFEEALPTSTPDLPEPGLVATPPAPRLARTARTPSRLRDSRAPPGAVTPPGLFPGTAPLRI